MPANLGLATTGLKLLSMALVTFDLLERYHGNGAFKGPFSDITIYP